MKCFFNLFSETYQAAVYRENGNGKFDIIDDLDTGQVFIQPSSTVALSTVLNSDTLVSYIVNCHCSIN